ncbi:MAG: hypothetical protein P8X74_05640 [Reinekea sp.]
MACALRRDGVTDSGVYFIARIPPDHQSLALDMPKSVTSKWMQDGRA